MLPPHPFPVRPLLRGPMQAGGSPGALRQEWSRGAHAPVSQRDWGGVGTLFKKELFIGQVVHSYTYERQAPLGASRPLGRPCVCLADCRRLPRSSAPKRPSKATGHGQCAPSSPTSQWSRQPGCRAGFPLLLSLTPLPAWPFPFCCPRPLGRGQGSCGFVASTAASPSSFASHAPSPTWRPQEEQVHGLLGLVEALPLLPFLSPFPGAGGTAEVPEE